jgi:glutamyl-tRNA reductase
LIVVVGLSHRSAPIEVRERLAFSREEVSAVLRELMHQPALAALEARAPGVSAHVYRHLGSDAVQHLFRVASSLDSLVLGEPQILGQLKQAFELAREAGSVGLRLNRTIPRAIRAAKRVRTETSVGSGQVSVPTVAVDLATQIFGELRGRTAALVGAGEMAETVARLLVTENVRLLVVGRDPAKVAELTDRIGGERGHHEHERTHPRGAV